MAKEVMKEFFNILAMLSICLGALSFGVGILQFYTTRKVPQLLAIGTTTCWLAAIILIRYKEGFT